MVVTQLEDLTDVIWKEVQDAMDKWIPITEELVWQMVDDAMTGITIFATSTIDKPLDANAPKEFKWIQEEAITVFDANAQNDYSFIEYQPKYWRSSSPNIPDIYIPYQFPSEDFKVNMKAYLSNYVTKDSILIWLTHFNGSRIQYKF